MTIEQFTEDGELEAQTRQWAMWLHLSLLAGYVVPLAGLVAPIVIWQVKKTDLPGLDVHGKNAVNWLLSVLVYAVAIVAIALMAALVTDMPLLGLAAIPLGIALGLCAVIFPIVAAIKASNGEVWRYPLAIAFV
ncbi:MAG: DUF4870 domain-containing protein [Planctomycetota bacterium]|jgi:uncharacterized Tic20 family protein